MKAVIEGNVVDYTSVNELAKSVIFGKMYQEGAKSMTAYMVGWAETMDEIEEQDDENHTPYTVESVMDIALGAIENEVGVVEGNTAYLGRTPKGFSEALESTVAEMLKAEA